MEEEKLLRKKKKALIGSNRRVLAEACNDLASFYYKQTRYSDALDEYKLEASICKELGLRMEWGTCNRMIGEMYMLLAEFEKALKFEEKHLAVAKELNNLVEEQRAMATLGRIYLLQGQSTTDNIESKHCLRAAEKAFLKSLMLCENLYGKIDKHELMDMRARLLLNIGVVQEYLENYDKAVECIHKAISICSNQDLFEVLHQCYMTEALLYSVKKKDYSKALSCLNKALEIASRLEDKVLKSCETLSTKADILCKMSDYQSAKQVLLKAWKLKTPNEEEREDIETNLRVVAAMCYTEDLLISTDPSANMTFKSLYEKLGDGACHLKNYSGAIQYYLKMLHHAELAGDCGKTLIPIYVSLYQTYKDMGSYNEALQYYEKEYDLIKDIPKEAYTTLYNIAEVKYLAKKPYEQVEQACMDARNAARIWNKKKYETRILKNLLKYQEEYCESEKMEITKEDLRALGVDDLENLELDEDDQSSAGGDEDTARIGDDICIEDLTDLSDTNEEEAVDAKREVRKRGKGYTIKKNMKGETQLHVACITGNAVLVSRLLSRGHPLNVRDNAGWLPLHEGCIHGRRDIVELLIGHGATVNDRGGANCDGITPLYDAASNGHLEIVELLLNKGAIPSLKTDFGETPLDVLQKWRQENILTKEQQVLYNNIRNRIHSYIEKSNTAEILRGKSKTPVKPIKDTTPPSTSKMSSRINELNSPIFKRRNILDDDSDSEQSQKDKAFPSEESNDSDNTCLKRKRNSFSVKEYKSAISALRKRNQDSYSEDEVEKAQQKPALLEPDEVDNDDWLVDDLGTNKGKKRKLNDPLAHVVIKRTSNESIKHSIIEINKSTEPLTENKNRSRNKVVDISDNSSDSDQCNKNENINPKKSIQMTKDDIINKFNETRCMDSREKMRKRCKTQSTLIKAGFQRKLHDNDQSSNSGSDTELNRSKSSLTRKSSGENFSSANKSNSFTRKCSGENFSYANNSSTLSRKSSGENFHLLGTNMNCMQHLNGLQPFNMVQPSRNGLMPIMPPAAVKVHVDDKVFLISLKLDVIHKQTISWLVEEVKTRYYKLTGIRPIFSLMTSDGAILSEEDPLSLVLSSTELKTSITNWKASPAEERYLECCDAMGILPCNEIQQAVGRTHTTHRLALGIRTLKSTQIRPLFRALTHQAHITAIMISNNQIGDDGMKHLTEAICTMKQLTHLDISSNNITVEATKCLLNLYEKASRPVCQSIEHIDLSDNEISDEGFVNIVKLGHYLPLKVLKLNSCGITENAFSEPNIHLNLNKLEILDLSNNKMRQGVSMSVISSLSSNLLVELDLDNISVEGNFVGPLSQFLDTAQQLTLRRLSLSNCKLVDGQFMRLYRSLSRAKHLQAITLRHNNLTFITLKKLLQRQPPVPVINLEGCQDIFKYSPDSDFQVWLPAIDFGRCIPEINVTPVYKSDEERDSFKSFSKTWLNCFKGRGIIEHGDANVIKFTAR